MHVRRMIGLLYCKTEIISPILFQAEHGFEIYRTILPVCDVTLFCVIAMSRATTNAG